MSAIDEMSDLPAALRDQHRNAEKVRRNAYEETPSDPPADPPKAESGEPKEEPPKPADTDPADPPKPETDWEAEYRKLQATHSTLEGKYRAEVPRLSQEVRELKDTNQQLQQQIETLKTDPPASQKQGDTDSQAVKDIIKRVEEDYGPELAELFTSLADARAEERVKPMADRFESLEKRQQETDQQRFMSELERLVPNWQEINSDAGFAGENGWLAQIDPMTGRQRQEALNDASQAMDANRVAAIFNLYQSETTPPAPARDRKAEREAQAAPGRKKAGAPPADQGKTYTARDLSELEAKAREGRISEDEYRSSMAEIQKAIQEGRYRR